MRLMGQSNLDSKLLELKKELMKTTSQTATGTTLKNPNKVKEIKRTIAKILTIKQDINKKGGNKKE